MQSDIDSNLFGSACRHIEINLWADEVNRPTSLPLFCSTLDFGKKGEIGGGGRVILVRCVEVSLTGSEVFVMLRRSTLWLVIKSDNAGALSRIE